jgi:hypothetical protein
MLQRLLSRILDAPFANSAASAAVQRLRHCSKLLLRSSKPNCLPAQYTAGCVQAKRSPLAGFSAEEVKRGLAATRTRKFAPNLPEFLHLCRPALDPEVAWIEAEQGMASHAKGERFAWSHPAVYWAGRQFGYELRSGTFERCRKRWTAALAAEFAKGAWATPADPTQRRIAAPEQQTFNPELAAQAREKLRELRRKMTGYSTPQEQEAALQRAEDQALQQEVEP